jgi:hypothetical protein
MRIFMLVTDAFGGYGRYCHYDCILSLSFTLPGLFQSHYVLFFSVVVLMFVGIVDDITHIHSAVRMLIQIGIG